MGIVAAIANGFKAVASIFGWASKRSDLNNAPDMKANASAQTDADAKAQAAADVNTKDPTAFEKGIS